MDNKKNYKFLYQKYKNKYLKLKENMKGGLIIISANENLDKCPKDTVYLPEFCNNEEFSCLKNDGFCHNFNDEKGEIKVSQDIVNKVFSTENKPVKIRLTSVTGFEITTPIKNPIEATGSTSIIFTLVDFYDKPINKLLRLSNNIDISTIFENFLKTNPNPSQEMIKNNFKDNIFLYESFKGIQLQHELRDTEQINTIYDYGRFKIELNNRVDNYNLNQVHPVGSYIPPAPGLKIENDNGTYAIIEECKGGDLFDRIFTNHYQNEENLRAIMKNILIGIKAIHDKGWVHLDIKPENIGMIYPLNKTLPENVPEVERHSDIRILDFGYSTLEGTYETAKGSADYISPEMESAYYSKIQKRIKKSDDMFSLGILMYELIHKFYPPKGEIIDYSSTPPQVIDDNLFLSTGYYDDPGDNFYIMTYKKKNLTAIIKLNWMENNIYKIINYDIEKNFNAILSCTEFLILAKDENVRTSEITIDPFRSLDLSDQVKELLAGLLELDEDDRFTVDDAFSSRFILNSAKKKKYEN